MLITALGNRLIIERQKGDAGVSELAIVTGVPKSTLYIIHSIKEAIRDLSGESREARIDQVVEIVTGQGFAKEKIEQVIKGLLREGECFEPRNGIIKLIGGM